MKDMELLEMKLSDISDLLLEKRCQDKKDKVYVECKGYDISTNERMVLTVCLRSEKNDYQQGIPR